jgi:hypothetical protein
MLPPVLPLTSLGHPFLDSSANGGSANGASARHRPDARLRADSL